MSNQSYQSIRFDEPAVQRQFEQLVQGVRAAEQARAPIAERHRTAERANEDGSMSNADFLVIDREYIAANNAIAAAKRAVETFLNTHRNYHMD